MASKMFQAFVNNGAFTGKQMKAITAFCDKKSRPLLSTPFFYDNYLFATNSICAVCVEKDEFQKAVLPSDYVFSLPAAPLVKITASDVFYFTQPASEYDMPEFIKLPEFIEYSAEVDNTTSSLNVTANALKNYFSDDNKTVAADELNVLGIDPKYMKLVCNLADAFNATCFNFEYTSKNCMRITFPGCERIKVIIMSIFKRS